MPSRVGFDSCASARMCCDRWGHLVQAPLGLGRATLRALSIGRHAPTALCRPLLHRPRVHSARVRAVGSGNDAALAESLVAMLLFISVGFLRPFGARAFGNEPEVTPRLDPGRSEVNDEWLDDGREIFRQPLRFGGGMLCVTAHPASSKEDLPPSVAALATQEWRVLRFEPEQGANDLVQSVTKVCIPPGLTNGSMRVDCLPLHYTKSFAAVVMASLLLLRPSFMKRDGQFGPRILCIGLGGGSVPSFLAASLPTANIDVVELEPTVVDAARTSLGFKESSRLCVSVGDGAAYALEHVNAGKEPYDAVLVDAYDADGNVPKPLWSKDGPLAEALILGLLSDRSLVAANFLAGVDVAPPLSAYKAALAHRGASRSFSVVTPAVRNRIAVQLCGPVAAEDITELQSDLRRVAKTLSDATDSPFPLDEYVAPAIQEWK